MGASYRSLEFLFSDDREYIISHKHQVVQTFATPLPEGAATRSQQAVEETVGQPGGDADTDTDTDQKVERRPNCR